MAYHKNLENHIALAYNPNMSHWTGKKHKPETIEKMRRMDIWNQFPQIKDWYKTKTTYWIAEKLSVSPSLIQNVLRKNGILLKRGGSLKGYIPWNKGIERIDNRGEKNPRWKGGITNLNQQIRHMVAYRKWINDVFKRDNWTCVLCRKRGGNLEADHFPKKFCELMKENNIKSQNDAKLCDILWDIKNGRTVCLKCHNKTKQVRSRFKKVLG